MGIEARSEIWLSREWPRGRRLQADEPAARRPEGSADTAENVAGAVGRGDEPRSGGFQRHAAAEESSYGCDPGAAEADQQPVTRSPADHQTRSGRLASRPDQISGGTIARRRRAPASSL